MFHEEANSSLFLVKMLVALVISTLSGKLKVT